MTLQLDRVDRICNPRSSRPVHAVRAMNMQLYKGEIDALPGSSGCRKTSTLRMIAGCEDLSNGTITLSDRAIQNEPPARRNVAMAFEGYSLYPPATVRENIAFALKARGRDPDGASAWVKSIAELLEIDDILERRPAALSVGRQRRAGLARSLVRNAGLSLLNEPEGQLEPRLRAMRRRHIKERELTVIFVTHGQAEANALADRIAVMEGRCAPAVRKP